MTKIKRKGVKTWKPLTLEGAILSSGVEGLIGIEELVDYSLENKSEKSSKRKISEDFSEESDEDDGLVIPKTASSNKKPANSKKKRKTGKRSEPKLLSSESEENPVTNESEDDLNFSPEAWTTLGVPPVIVKALKDQKFSTPTSIQSLTLPPAILGRRDILGAAETGSGKTLAFGIPILSGILELKSKQHEISNHELEISRKIDDCGATSTGWTVSSDGGDDVDEKHCNPEEEESEEEHPDRPDEKSVGCVRVIDNIDSNDFIPSLSCKPLYALILTPTRELAIQIKNHISRAAKYTDIKVAVVVGGMAAVKQERILSKGPEIVIATPGRLWELIDQGNPHLTKLNSLKYLAIDETDRMLEKGHFQELHQILERVNSDESSVQDRQTFVFSATLTLVHDIPDYLQRKKKGNSKSKIFKLTPGQKLQKIIALLKIKNPKIVDVTKARGTAGTLTECRITCTMDHKDYYLYYFLRRHRGRTLIFCNSIGCVKRLATLFGILECNPLPLHASMQQRQRLKNLEKFQESPEGLLIATDVAARGLDIPNVEHVIHYQVPRTSEGYVHRSGRTARAQKEGITVLMMEPSELSYYTKLCKTLGHTNDIPTFPVVDKLLMSVKERVNVAREIDKLELRCRRDNVQKGWLKKAVEDMDLVLDEDQVESTMESKESAELRRQLKRKRQQLRILLLKPLFPKGFSGKYLEMNTNVQIMQENQTAVQVMKKAIDENPRGKQKKSIGIARKSQNIRKRKVKRGTRTSK
ncbi:ATP-dependent RNA helicase DDX24 [Fopius arisanus]|uniref:ATP-dependent RNA helicase n=1 Tax=Fopius arisanus TaxID=64838 RepID=A0A0C9QR67_9HYME|nr:PREDICTED: ATP-dependent RNA helicase DDX24 [Fopius arisanus]